MNVDSWVCSGCGQVYPRDALKSPTALERLKTCLSCWILQLPDTEGIE